MKPVWSKTGSLCLQAELFFKQEWHRDKMLLEPALPFTALSFFFFFFSHTVMVGLLGSSSESEGQRQKNKHLMGIFNVKAARLFSFDWNSLTPEVQPPANSGSFPAWFNLNLKIETHTKA